MTPLPEATPAAPQRDPGEATGDLVAPFRAADTLVARGALPPKGFWHGLLSRGVVQAESSLGGAVVRVVTGLLVKPARGVLARTLRSTNRASSRFTVNETSVVDDDGYVPLVVECRPVAGVEDFVLEGDVATLAALPRGVSVRSSAVEARPELVRAHLDFYDPTYFAAKREGEVTRKYRRLFAGDDAPADDGPGALDVVDGAAPAWREERTARVATARGVTETSAPTGVVVFHNEVRFEARFDGDRVRLAWDHAALDRRTAAIEARWRPLVADAADPRGALWYFTRYFTPHPAGEAHLFTKPCAFVVTPRGWSSVVEGVGGDAWDVLRGVVRTDHFHATPAVYTLRAGAAARVPEGRAVTRVMAVPRAMALPRVRVRRFEEVFPA